jgi:NAD(P)-dependent dehydrogenase (short-subunit alcohol dehydrogenase family)
VGSPHGTPTHARPCATTAPTRTWTGTPTTSSPATWSPERNRLALTDAQRFTAKLSKIRKSTTAYSLSKAFVIWYSRQTAARFGANGARILSVSPGSFDTAMGRLEKKSGSERLIAYAALKRFGTPDEMAELLAFCASGKPGYLTGVDILCDGGTEAGLTLKSMLALAKAE